MRYVISLTVYGTPVSLFRIVDTKEEIFRQEEWVDSENTIAKALVTGDTGYETVTEEEARNLFPTAFKET